MKKPVQFLYCIALHVRPETTNTSRRILLQTSPIAGFQYHRSEDIGYVPRSENTAISQMLDRNERLTAKISTLQYASNPWGTD